MWLVGLAFPRGGLRKPCPLPLSVDVPPPFESRYFMKQREFISACAGADHFLKTHSHNPYTP